MASVYRRKGIWRISYVDATGRHRDMSLRTRDEDVARERSEAIETVEQRKRLTGAYGRTVKSYAEAWRNRRRERIATADLDYQRLRDHVLPMLGDRLLADVTYEDLVHWSDELICKDLAPKTRWNIYGALRKLFKDAEKRGHVKASPCRLTREELGEKRDADPEWRPSSVFTRDECQALISDDRLDMDHRLINGFGVLAGLRLGEVAGLRWGDVDLDAGRLRVARSYKKGTKTGVVRDVPIHPTLHAMIAEWRLAYRGTFKADIVGPELLVVPSVGPRTFGKMYTVSVLSKRFPVAAKVLGIDTDARRGEKGGRSFQDLRATFIELAIEDGARPDVLESITHTRMMRSAFDMYRRITWQTKVTEVRKLRLQRSCSAHAAHPGKDAE